MSTQQYLEILTLNALDYLDLSELDQMGLFEPAPTVDPPKTTFTCDLGDSKEEVSWLLVKGAYISAMQNCRQSNDRRSISGIHR